MDIKGLNSFALQTNTTQNKMLTVKRIAPKADDELIISKQFKKPRSAVMPVAIPVTRSMLFLAQIHIIKNPKAAAPNESSVPIARIVLNTLRFKLKIEEIILLKLEIATSIKFTPKLNREIFLPIS